MTQPLWSAVDRHISNLLVGDDPVLDGVLAANAAAGLPPHDVAPNQGKMLHLLARLIDARRILEIGTLGGYSTVWLGRALQPGGIVVTLEADPQHAAVARENFRRTGLDGAITLMEGDAATTLDRLVAEGEPPFDMVFIDADKPSNPVYLRRALALSRPGTLILGDNVVRGGGLIDPDGDEKVQGVRRFLEIMAEEPGLSATAIQTVGEKGHDGFVLALVQEPDTPAAGEPGT
jgi:predicted O-methyltransferase YrrM